MAGVETLFYHFTNPTTSEITTTSTYSNYQRLPCLQLTREVFQVGRIFFFGFQQATRGVVNFYSAGVESHDRT
jgi:hypothetical protein